MVAISVHIESILATNVLFCTLTLSPKHYSDMKHLPYRIFIECRKLHSYKTTFVDSCSNRNGCIQMSLLVTI